MRRRSLARVFWPGGGVGEAVCRLAAAAVELVAADEELGLPDTECIGVAAAGVARRGDGGGLGIDGTRDEVPVVVMLAEMLC